MNKEVIDNTDEKITRYAKIIVYAAMLAVYGYFRHKEELSKACMCNKDEITLKQDIEDIIVKEV